MISIFSTSSFLILLIANQILCDECVKKSPCECTFENGFGYDLSGLDKAGRKNLEANSSSVVGIQYIFQPCTDSTTLPENHDDKTNPCYPGFAVCLHQSGNFTLLAKNEDAVLKVNPDSTPYLVYSHGNNVVTIALVCSNSEHNYLFENGPYTADTEVNLILFSKHTCIQEIFVVSTLSTGALLNITLLLIIFGYLTIGVAVDYFLMGARGIEVIPHLEFWKDFPFLVRDGIKFIQNGFKIQPSDLSENRDVYTSI
ncbi:Cation-dependent mannose-6-phosphate receptor [Pseudolycoriella hygida]|uniref:Cation-dependent mannose-6-phosphate receptor n=1 Tax=Pseudolycoriella hygida TaxID=35572 RepID=A0A9Q0RY29_9DIPT|nr:Cation-dependent mannose-6-phosphate receptor [Pseudolycoriella hygida]